MYPKSHLKMLSFKSPVKKIRAEAWGGFGEALRSACARWYHPPSSVAIDMCIFWTTLGLFFPSLYVPQVPSENAQFQESGEENQGRSLGWVRRSDAQRVRSVVSPPLLSRHRYVYILDHF